MLLIAVAACSSPSASPNGPTLPPASPHPTSQPPSSPSQSPTIPPLLALPSPECPASPRLGIYNPDAFEVLETCKWFRGRVTKRVEQSDLDWQVNLAPDPGYEDLMNEENVAQAGGSLVIQIMPGQRLRIPSVGEHVSVYGTWVRNLNTGWNEIHPVWSIEYSDTGIRVVALPPRQPQFTPASPS